MSRESKKNSYRTFWYAFILSLAALGIIFAIFYWLVLNQNTHVSEQNIKVPMETSYEPQTSDSQNILIIGCPKRGQSATFFLLLRFDSKENQCNILSLPPQVSSTVNIQTMRLSDHYDYGGTEYAVAAAENLFLIHIQHYIRVDSSGITKLIDFFGGVEADLPYQITTEHYQFSSGTQRLDGARVADLMLYEDTALHASLTAQFIESCLNESLINKKTSFYNIIFNDCDTDYTSLDLANLSRPIENFLKHTESKTQILTLDGEYAGEGNEFIPDESSISALKQIFSAE
jgi:LCP family protein required for cell wall assembly